MWARATLDWRWLDEQYASNEQWYTYLYALFIQHVGWVHQTAATRHRIITWVEYTIIHHASLQVFPIVRSSFYLHLQICSHSYSHRIIINNLRGERWSYAWPFHTRQSIGVSHCVFEIKRGTNFPAWMGMESTWMDLCLQRTVKYSFQHLYSNLVSIDLDPPCSYIGAHNSTELCRSWSKWYNPVRG